MPTPHLYRRDLLIFILLFLILILTQFILLRPVMGSGFEHDDLTAFASLIPWREKLSTDPFGSWIQFGPWHTYKIYYLYFLNSFFGLDYSNYLIFNILLKMLASFSFYFLIQVIIKNKLVSFLSAILFSISSASVGPLAYYQTAIEYLAIAFMNFFLIFYYWSIQKPRFSNLFFSSILLSLTFISAPVRVFPILILIPLIELLILFRNKGTLLFHNKLSNISLSFIRSIILFIPIILIIFPVLGNDQLHHTWVNYSLQEVFKLIFNIFLINPLTILGYLFIPASNLAIFGQINTTSFLRFLFAITIPFLIFASITFLFSLALSTRPNRFFLTWMAVNILMDVGVFFLLVHPLALKQIEVTQFNAAFIQVVPYAMLIGAFILSLGFTCGIEWIKSERRNDILLWAFVASFFALAFFTLEFLVEVMFIGKIFVTRQLYILQGGLHRYLTISALGSSLFIACLLTLIYQNSNKKIKGLSILTIVVVLFMIFLNSKNEISTTFLIKRGAGVDLATQQSMQNQLLNHLSPVSLRGDNIFLIQLENGIDNPTPWEEAFDWRHLTVWLHIRKYYLLGDYTGCIAEIYDIDNLAKMMERQNGQWGFLYIDDSNKQGQCFINGKAVGVYGKFFTLNDFLAFKIEGPVVKNITDEIKPRLMISKN